VYQRLTGARAWLLGLALFLAVLVARPALAAEHDGLIKCRAWTDDLFAKVAALINARYIPVRVDQNANPDLSTRYGDWGWPATIIFAPNGTEIVKRRGYIPPVFMVSLLQAIIDAPSPGPTVLPELDVKPASNGALGAAQHRQVQDDYWPDVLQPGRQAAAFACTNNTCSLPVFTHHKVTPMVMRLLKPANGGQKSSRNIFCEPWCMPSCARIGATSKAHDFYCSAHATTYASDTRCIRAQVPLPDTEELVTPGAIRRSASKLDQSVTKRNMYQLDIGVDTEFAANPCPVSAHGLRADTQTLGNFVLSLRLAHHHQNLQFTAR